MGVCFPYQPGSLLGLVKGPFPLGHIIPQLGPGGSELPAILLMYLLEVEPIIFPFMEMSCSEREITHLIQPLLLNTHMHREDLCQLPALCIHSFQSWQNKELHPIQPPQIMFEK